jgi:hypothetical protein
MPHYKYLIIGGGMTADAAIRGIREVGPRGPRGPDWRRNTSSVQSPALVQGAIERQTS